MSNLNYEVDNILAIFDCKINGLTVVGSKVTCEPPPTYTDEDWLVLVDEQEILGLAERLDKQGFILGGSVVVNRDTLQNPINNFWSYTRNDLNLIITCSKEFYGRFKLATSVAKRLNLRPKQARIDLFQIILYHKTNYIETLKGGSKTPL